MFDIKRFYGPNAGYVIELYERYLQDPASVDAATRAIFDTWSPESQFSPVHESITTAVPFDVHDVVAAAPLAAGCRGFAVVSWATSGRSKPKIAEASDAGRDF